MTPHTAVLQLGGDQSVRTNRRRSVRIPSLVPLIMSGFTPYKFSECCGTVTVSAHGCQIRSFRPLNVGMQVRLYSININRVAGATVIHVETVEQELATRVWNCGLALDTPENFWGVLSPPCDWSSANGSKNKDEPPSRSSQDEEHRRPTPEGVPRGPELLARELQQTMGAVDARIAGLEARLEQATAEFETGALVRLQQSFGEAIRQAQERMKHYAEACGHSRLVDLEAELERRLESFLSRSQAATTDLERLLQTLRQEQAGWEARTAEWQQYGEQLHGRLTEETQRFHAMTHDAVVEATGQVKGRIDTIVDGARELLERRMRDTDTRLEALVVHKSDDLTRQHEANIQHLLAVQEETSASFRARLEAQQAEALDLFRRQAMAAMGQAVAHMSEMLNTAFGSAPPASQVQPSALTAPPPVQPGAGDGRKRIGTYGAR